MTVESNPPADPGVNPGYEVRDTNVRAVVTFLIGLTLFILVVQVALWGLLRGLSASSAPADAAEVAAAEAQVTAPEMLGNQLMALRNREADELGLNKGAEAAPGRLTIEQAIDSIAERGLPATAPGRTQVDVNSHSGKPAGTETPGAKDAPDNKAQGGPGRGGDR